MLLIISGQDIGNEEFTDYGFFTLAHIYEDITFLMA